jgi:hypothetical protein
MFVVPFSLHCQALLYRELMGKHVFVAFSVIGHMHINSLYSLVIAFSWIHLKYFTYKSKKLLRLFHHLSKYFHQLVKYTSIEETPVFSLLV